MSSSTCPRASPARTAPSCWPTAVPRSSKSKRRRAIRCGGGRPPGPGSRPGLTARWLASLPGLTERRSRTPVFVGGQVGEYLAGAYASAATMASRLAGAGELVDLSMLETQILGLTYYPVGYYQMLGRPWRDARRLTVPGIARAKDGLIDI